MPWDAFPYEPQGYSKRKPQIRGTSSGTEAFDRAVRAAFRGRKDDAEVACLRGILRRAVIELADSMRSARADEEKRGAAANRFRENLRGYCIVAEKSEGGVCWRARMPRAGLWEEGGIYAYEGNG